MRAIRQRTIVGLFLFTFMQGSAWADNRPLPSDPRIETGKLRNGVTWMYRRHDNPPGKMALMLRVDSGSLNETEEQRGLAHFLEHLCFNGTENFPPGALIPYFESIGMEFGADLNAFTGFDQTVYMLFTPDTSKEQIDKALMVLSDYACRALLLAEEIDKERGVVLEESRSGKNAFQRIRDKLWPELFEGSRFAQRLPIGDEGIIAKAQRKEFEDYYRTWYRPENTTVLLAGDAPSTDIIPLIEKWFSEYKPTSPARKPSGPQFTPFSKKRTMVVTDPEMAVCQVQIMNIREGRPSVTTAAQWRQELVEQIGGWIMGRRFRDMVQRGEAAFRNANARINSFYRDAVMAAGSATGEPKDWTKMLEQLVTEVSRAREHGFTQRELDLAKKELLNDAEQAVKTEPTRDARELLMDIIFSLNERTPVRSAEQELGLYKEQLSGVQLSEVNATFREPFGPQTLAYTVTMAQKEGVAVPSRDDVMAAANAAWSRKMEPIKEDAAPGELLAKAPTRGKIAESKADSDLQITSAWLSNGVRVHHRFMDYKKNEVIVSIALAGGAIEETSDNAGVTDAAALAINTAATSKLSSTNIRDLTTGKTLRLGAFPAGDTLMLSLEASPDDLETGLQLVHVLLTDGKIEESAFQNWKLRSLQTVEMMDKNPRFRGTKAVMELLGGGDPRVMPMSKEKVERQTLASAQAWFDRLRLKSPIEVAVVGDVSLDKTMPLIEIYLGSLAERPRGAAHLDKLRKLGRSTGPLEKKVDVETVTPQAMAVTGFFGPEAKNTQERRALDLAEHVLTSRLVKRIREELAIVYSIQARSSPAWIYADSGQFGAGAPCDPEKANEVVVEVKKIFGDFAERGPTAEELDNAKKQIANNLDTGMREPGYWLSVLQKHDLHHRDLNEEKAEKEAFQKFTAEQVQTVFKKYWTPQRQFHVVALPTGAKDENAGDKKNQEKKEPATTKP